MKPLLVVCMIAFVRADFLFAQDVRQNIRSDKRPDPSAVEAAARLFPFHPITTWTGKRFIFLPKPKSSRGGDYEDFSGKISHEKYAGRIARVVAVNDFNGRAHVEFEMEDTGEHLRAQTVVNKESLKGMALADDLENARKQWAGKTLWCRMSMISTYDEQSDTLSPLRVKKYSPLKIIDVVSGWDETKPVRFQLETADGKRGFLDMNMSGTNVQKDLRYSSGFDEHLLTADPRLKYKWPAHIWKSIEKAEIVSGMTAEQVKMSWGEPEKIARTAAVEQWTYPGGTLLLKNGILIGTQ